MSQLHPRCPVPFVGPVVARDARSGVGSSGVTAKRMSSHDSGLSGGCMWLSTPMLYPVMATRQRNTQRFGELAEVEQAGTNRNSARQRDPN
jgi:hypothetical protein